MHKPTQWKKKRKGKEIDTMVLRCDEDDASAVSATECCGEKRSRLFPAHKPSNDPPLFPTLKSEGADAVEFL
jgi:hypothetical protein